MKKYLFAAALSVCAILVCERLLKKDSKGDKLRKELFVLNEIDCQDEVTEGIERKARIKKIEKELRKLELSKND